jgi:hypothetical protein
MSPHLIDARDPSRIAILRWRAHRRASARAIGCKNSHARDRRSDRKQILEHRSLHWLETVEPNGIWRFLFGVLSPQKTNMIPVPLRHKKQSRGCLEHQQEITQAKKVAVLVAMEAHVRRQPEKQSFLTQNRLLCCNARMPASGTFETSGNVRSSVAIGGKADVSPTWRNRRECRVGPGNFTPSPSQIRT